MLYIIKKEILHNLRDKKSMILMTVFPMLMMVILGTVFASSFQSSGSIPKINVIYSVEKNSDISKQFKVFADDIEKTMNVNFTEVTDEKNALENISNGTCDTYLKFENTNKILFYTNNLRVFNSNLVLSLMNTFVDKSNLISEIATKKPMALSKIDNSVTPNYVEFKSIVAGKEPTGLEYYSITMFTMIILYSIPAGAFTILGEIGRRTYGRLLCSGISKSNILFGKLIGCCAATSFQIFLIYLFSRYILKTNWGNNYFAIIGISLSAVIMAVSVGIGLANMIKNSGVVAIAMHILIPIMVFLGGGYIPLNFIGSNALNAVSIISPIKWTNEALFKMIYGNNLSTIPIAIAINLIIAMVFLITPILWPRKDVI